MSHKGQSRGGFTLIEVIMVMVIVGILAAIMVFRYDRSADTDGTMAASQLIADIQYVQMRAVGIGRPQSISLSVGSGSYSIFDIGEGGNVVEIERKKLPDPGSVVVIHTNLPNNTLVFNTLGEPTFSSSQNGTIALGKGATTYRTVTIFPITGKIL